MDLNQLETLKIRLLPGEFKYREDSKMAGQTYNRYTVGGKVFISNDLTFKQNVEDGKLYSVSIDSDDEGQLSMTDFITWKQANNQQNCRVEFDSITVENVRAKAGTLHPFQELS